MNYSTRTKQLHEFVSANPGVLSTDIQDSYDRKLISRLIKNGVLTTKPGPREGRGRPAHRLYAGTAPPQVLKKSLQMRTGKYRPVQDAIVAYLGTKGEATIGQIAGYLQKPTNDISGTLLTMASSGRIVRRRVLGEISGRTQKCEWYAYRLPEG